MDPAEYLAFVPLLFYGIALADLLGQWRRFFDRNYFYLPFFLTTIMFTEGAIWNVYKYLDVVSILGSVRYAQYWSYLIQPILFLITVSALTPESDIQNTKGYFHDRISLVYGLISIFIASHFLSLFGLQTPFNYMNNIRIILILLTATIAITKKVWLIYLVAIFELSFIVIRMIYA